MPNYFAVTDNQVWDLGFFVSNKEAEDYAINQFNLHQAPRGYLVVNTNELKELVRLSNKRLKVDNIY